MIANFTETDVLIIGAGPSGLALAGELQRLGIRPVIIDQQAADANTSRACVVHARTLEVLEPLGVTADLIAEGIKVPIFRVRDRDRALMTIKFDHLPSAYQYSLMCTQDRTEKALLAHFERLGGEVVRPAELMEFTDREDGMEARFTHLGETHTVRTRWLAGCDGMHSRVRETANIPFRGGSYAQSFSLADVHMDWPLSRDEVTLFCSPDGFMVVSPLSEERFRIVATVDEAPESPSVEFMQALLARGPSKNPGRIHDIVWGSRFRVQHRVAETPRRGRVLLCGDAAHVHSPAGGQGMNTGIQDAVSLAAALTATLRDGDASRLDVWAADRHHIASKVVALTDRMTKMATLKSPTGKLLRNAAIAFAGQLPSVRNALALNLAELKNR